MAVWEREVVPVEVWEGEAVPPEGELDMERFGVGVADCTTTPPKLNPSDMEFTAQEDPVYLKAQGSAQGATCRSTGHVHVAADCTEAHFTLAAPVCVTTTA